MRIALLGFSFAGGSGHAVERGSLLRELSMRGHEVLFCQPGEIYAEEIGIADLAVVDSQLPEEEVDWVLERSRGVTAFYDANTLVTLGKLRRRERERLTSELVGRFDLYLSSSGGPVLDVLEAEFGVRRAIAFYPFVDANTYRPAPIEHRWDLGHLGAYCADRQPLLERLLLEPAMVFPTHAFAVAGPGYSEHIAWPANVEQIAQVPPWDRPRFYAAQRFTLNGTPIAERAAGWSPSLRLFEAAACGVPTISDPWDGLEEVLTPGEEILLAESASDMLGHMADVSEDERREIGARARARVLAEHTAARRCELLEEVAGALVR
jgi:spore maturation protein CgeB